MGTGHRQVHHPVAEEVEVLGSVVGPGLDGQLGEVDGLGGLGHEPPPPVMGEG
jgi:hypothetical protein